jgi:hypothetical protein
MIEVSDEEDKRDEMIMKINDELLIIVERHHCIAFHQHASYIMHSHVTSHTSRATHHWSCHHVVVCAGRTCGT